MPHAAPELHRFDADTVVTSAGAGHWIGQVSDRWDIGTVPNGGYVLAIALAGVRSAVKHPHPLTTTAHYLGPCDHGRVDIDVDVVKEGRSLSSVTARLSQDGRARLLVVSSFSDLAAQEGPTVVTAAPPSLPDPEAYVAAMEGRPTPFPIPPTITEQIEFRPSPESANSLLGSAKGDARLSGWIRFTDGRPPDTACLPLFCDALPPAVFAAMFTGWVPTLELTVHVRAVPAPGWIAAVASSRVIVDGLLEEDCELWDSAGQLVAMSRQLARVLEPVR
ncbi:MAG: thioesterase family protein [Acidimicrobiales bacterium]